MRAAALLIGLAVLALAWAMPVFGLLEASFTRHMITHMGVVAIAAPLIGIGLAGISFSPFTGVRRTGRDPWLDPGPEGADEGQRRRRRKSSAAAPPLICLPASSPRERGEESFSPPFATSLPIIASLIDLVVVWGWHAPALRALAETSPVAAVAEQASFLAAGLFLWIVCIGGGDSARNAAGAFGLLLTSVHMTLLGALLALSARPLYGLGEVTCFGVPLTAVEDQQLGGVVMLLVGAAVYLAGGIALLARVLARAEPSGGVAR